MNSTAGVRGGAVARLSCCCAQSATAWQPPQLSGSRLVFEASGRGSNPGVAATAASRSGEPCRAVPCRAVPCRAEPSRAEPSATRWQIRSTEWLILLERQTRRKHVLRWHGGDRSSRMRLQQQLDSVQLSFMVLMSSTMQERCLCSRQPVRGAAAGFVRRQGPPAPWLRRLLWRSRAGTTQLRVVAAATLAIVSAHRSRWSR